MSLPSEVSCRTRSKCAAYASIQLGKTGCLAWQCGAPLGTIWHGEVVRPSAVARDLLRHATRHRTGPQPRDRFLVLFCTAKKKAPSVSAKCLISLPNLVGANGVEPSTPTMSMWRCRAPIGRRSGWALHGGCHPVERLRRSGRWNRGAEHCAPGFMSEGHLMRRLWQVPGPHYRRRTRVFRCSSWLAAFSMIFGPESSAGMRLCTTRLGPWKRSRRPTPQLPARRLKAQNALPRTGRHFLSGRP